MPALRRKRRRFPLLPQLPPPSAAKGETPVLPPFPALAAARYFLRFKHSPIFQVFNLNPCQLFDRLPDHIFAVGMHASRPYRNALSPSPLFPAKAAHQLPRQSARKRFSARLPVLPAFYKQNLRIILTHNHRRRCGNDFIADARSARFRRFLPNLQPLMSPSAGYQQRLRPPGNDVGNIAAADARRMHGINPGICRLAAVNVKIRINRLSPAIVTSASRWRQGRPGVDPCAGTPSAVSRTNTGFLHLLIITPISPPTSLSATTPTFSSDSAHKRVRAFAALFFVGR